MGARKSPVICISFSLSKVTVPICNVPKDSCIKCVVSVRWCLEIGSSGKY